jgi:predicted ABC-type ATPase/outer membrane protein OmpA-like peptidoglycan-associated protein
VSTKRRNPADDVKAVIVFAGPNGSGKSSITRSYLANPENGFSGAYVNADDIAVGMTRQIPDARERNIAAAQEAERQRLALLKTGKSFVFETVMSTPEKVALLSQAREQGYSVTLVFVTTCDPDINVSRVADRVAKGGHDVDSSAVHSRYESAMKLLPVAIEQADSVVVLDNSRDGESAQVVAMKHDRGALEIMKGPLTPPWAFERLENDFKARLESLAELASALQSEGCERLSRNAVLPGLHSPVRVQIGPTAAIVKSRVPLVAKEPAQQLVPEPAAATTVPADTNTELLAARKALKLAEQQIDKLRAELDKMKATGNAQGPRDIDRKLDRLESLVAEAASVILRVEFGFASAEFKPADDVARVLVPAAKAADRITVRGFTDSPVIDEHNTRIALARALAARQYLIEQGVDAKKIRAFYNSAGGFVADNNTPEGRAKNRRVDIELVNTKLAKLSQATNQLAKK